MSDASAVQAPPKPHKKRKDMSTGTLIDPVRRARAIKLLSLRRPKMEITKTLKMDHYTLGAIEQAYLPDIAAKRQHAADKAYMALTTSLESAQIRAEEGKAGALDAKLLSETWLNLSGEAIGVVDVHHHFPALQDFERMTAGRVIENDG